MRRVLSSLVLSPRGLLFIFSVLPEAAPVARAYLRLRICRPYGLNHREIQKIQREYLLPDRYDRLSAEEKVILLLIPHDHYVSNQDIRVYTPGLHAVDLGKMLSHLTREGYLQSKGRSNAKKYTLFS